MAVHTVTAEVMGGRQMALMNQPLRRVIERLDEKVQPDPQLMGEDVEEGCVITAKDWLNTHPSSVRAQVVSERGIQAEVGYHTGLLLEMFTEYDRARSL